MPKPAPGSRCAAGKDQSAPRDYSSTARSAIPTAAEGMPGPGIPEGKSDPLWSPLVKKIARGAREYWRAETYDAAA